MEAKSMKPYKVFLLAFISMLLTFLYLVPCIVASQHTYVGVEACKMCHEKQYRIWEASAHARAFAILDANQKTNPKCLSCHTTNGTALLPNVQCEACHGPGSDYVDMDTMKNFKKVWAAGLNRNVSDTCVKCHNKSSPTFKGFDFKAYWMEIMH
jgi:hypothetical protein